jgi:hypothetical protein
VLAFLLALASATLFYGATPSDALKKVVYPAPGAKVTITRVNTFGRYAVVLSRGALMESNPAAPILFERFSFGWQALESLDFRCRLDVHEIGAVGNEALMRGMPEPGKQKACGENGGRDSGPTADIETLRSQSGPLVPSVTVVDNFAMVSWYGAGGGEQIYRKAGGKWIFMLGGGGAWGSQDLIAHGVPARDLCPLGVYDAKCPKK